MKTMCFSVFDSKAAVFGTPFFMSREAAAIRAFSDLANDPNTMVGKHPSDFSLFHIGDFDDDLATFDSVKPRCLATAAGLVRVASLAPGNVDNGIAAPAGKEVVH